MEEFFEIPNITEFRYFKARFGFHLKQEPSDEAAYEATEKEHLKLYGKRRFKNYRAFIKLYSRRVMK